MDREKKLHYYKYIVKRHLNDIRHMSDYPRTKWREAITAPAMPPN